MRNQIKWSDTLSFVEYLEWSDELWVLRAPKLAKLLLEKAGMMQDQ
jgi:hypothetical protein